MTQPDETISAKLNALIEAFRSRGIVKWYHPEVQELAAALGITIKH